MSLVVPVVGRKGRYRDVATGEEFGLPDLIIVEVLSDEPLALEEVKRIAFDRLRRVAWEPSDARAFLSMMRDDGKLQYLVHCRRPSKDEP